MGPTYYLEEHHTFVSIGAPYEKETLTQVVSCSFCKIFKNTCGHLLLSIKGTKNCLCPRVPYDIEGSVISQYSEKKTFAD